MEAVPRRLVLGGLLAVPLAAIAAGVADVADAERKPPPVKAPTTTTTSIASPRKPKPTGIPGDWRLVLGDDFSGPTLDTTLWNTQYPWGEDNNGDGSENCYLPANVAHDGEGHLVLTGQRGEVSGTGSDGQAKTWPYSSGQVNTWDTFSLTYGALETRAQVPAGLGTWPAFWALPADGGWPPEVDVMEVYGTDPGTVDTTYHWGRADNPKAKDHETTLPGGTAFSDDFHIFGCNVTREAITWYLDGVEQWSFTKTAKIAQLKPLYVVCNLAIGGSGGDPTDTPMPVHCVVDYIRAWEPA